MPKLLSPLIDSKTAMSLERLKLVAIDIELSPKNTSSTQNIDTNTKDFVVLNYLMLSNDEAYALDCSVRYVTGNWRVRTRNHAEKILPSPRSELISISKQDLREFFVHINQDNKIFYDQELALLCGRTRVIIPTTVMITLLAQAAPLYRHYQFSFLKSASVDEPMAIAHEGSTWVIYQHDHACVVLEGSV